MPHGRAFAAYDPRRALGRLLLAIVVGIATAVGLPGERGWALRAVAGWDAGALALLAIAWWIIGHADVKETRRRAAANDPGRGAVWLICLVCSTFSVFAATVVLRQAKSLAPEASGVLVALCLGAVVTAWAVTHTSYTLRYAHLYYRVSDGEGEGGIEFPGNQPPNDVDFAYFGFTVGMCFQVSDATVSSHGIRRAVLGHAVLSFAYNTAILALALNLLAGMLG